MAKRIDLLSGSIVGPLTRLALPIMGASLIQMAYNTIDMIWIGRVGAGAVASVGAAGMFMWLSNGLMILARMGGQILTAQHLGAGEVKEAGRCAQSALQMGSIFALLYMLAIIAGVHPLIGFFNLNSPQVIRDAEVYLWIVSASMLPSFLNQILTSLITTTGNSRTPFIAMTIGLVFNILLDPLLIFGMGPLPEMGAAGAAVATVLAQVVVTLIFLLHIRKDSLLFPHVHFFGKPDLAIWKKLLALSAPSALQSTLFPLISMVIARLVAAWGDTAVAVQKVGSQIESISWMTADGFSVAVSSFIAQNHGAGNDRRAKEGYRIAMGVITVWGLLCSCMLIFLGGPVFRLFIPDPEALPMGVSYLAILGVCEMFGCWEAITAGSYAGFGHTLTPSLVSILLTATRIPASMVLSSTALGLDGIWWSISISAICKGVLLVILFFFFLRRRIDPGIKAAKAK